ncbi:tetratricopeptide repeat protein [Pontivivens ytuae]|uniref:Tetratricopeptide repeat protein n=1 Tax=Pontivivens ytuae TaxID=2789856 RepID=A0A7S9QD36_9RHOB|nr:tetratricopeptide repeat protein [Pontivivens ytuae]QPH53736.1 tetratricopeptide repeat protein [Pontivivens ytuae]
MSDTDSFIDEVSEEVRRDRLYRYLRRYGWIAIVLVLLIVGGAAFNEWRQAQARAGAETFGGALAGALTAGDLDTRIASLEELTAGAEGDAAHLAAFARAQALVAADRPEEAAAAFAEIAASDADPLYTSLATLRANSVPGALPTPQERIDAMTDLLLEDAPFSLLAMEQRALALIEEGDIPAAHADFETILNDPLATRALRDRTLQMLIATGGDAPVEPTLVTPSQGN